MTTNVVTSRPTGTAAACAILQERDNRSLARKYEGFLLFLLRLPGSILFHCRYFHELVSKSHDSWANHIRAGAQDSIHWSSVTLDHVWAILQHFLYWGFPEIALIFFRRRFCVMVTLLTPLILGKSFTFILFSFASFSIWSCIIYIFKLVWVSIKNSKSLNFSKTPAPVLLS